MAKSSSHLRYITQIKRCYQPHIFKSTGQLNAVLSEKTLLNLSSSRLSLNQIEALSAGLGFIPTMQLIADKEKEVFTAATEQLVKQVNTSLQLHKDETAALLNHEVAKTQRGHLWNWVVSRWQPDRQRWQYNPNANHILFKLSNPMIPTAEPPKPAQSGQRQHRWKPKTWRKMKNKEPEYTHPAIIYQLKQLAENKDIHIMKADKGGAIVIQDTVDYDREAMRQLSDAETYKSLTLEEYMTQLKEAHTQMVDAAIILRNYGHISEKELDAIREAPLKGSAAYFLPKIHKQPNKESGTCPGRPIIATHSCAVRLADKLLTEWTGPLLPLIDGSLIDTTDLLNKLPKGPLSKTTTVTTADVDSLYPSIPHERGVRASIQFYREHLEELKEHCRVNNLLPPPPPAFFGRLLEIVLGNSLIHFKNRFWVRQIKGTAMGMCISVYFANCYMWDVTRKIRENPPPGTVTFLRFIDDILVIQADGNRATVEEIFKSITDEHTKYTIDPPAREGNFLDVTIYFGPEEQLETKPFSKPTSTMTFLHYASNHPEACKHAIPYSQLIRLRRITTRTEYFKLSAEKLLEAFINRGYPRKMLKKYLQEVLAMSQEELLSSSAVRQLKQRQRILEKHEEELRRARKYRRTYKIPAKTKYVLEAMEREKSGQTTETTKTTTLRFITPYSATLDEQQLRENLQKLYETIQLTYPEGDARHKLIAKTRTTITHKKRKSTELLFTGIIKNPRLEEEK